LSLLLWGTRRNFGWTFWKVVLTDNTNGATGIAAGKYHIVARAVDTANQHMPSLSCPIFSWRGVLNNAWLKLPVVAK